MNNVNNTRSWLSAPSATRATHRGGLALLLTLGLYSVGCAAPPPPRSVDQATQLLKSQETQELEATRPKLIAEAKRYADAARRAASRGDSEKANLYAHLAIQRYETAKNFTGRDAAQKLGSVMERSRGEAELSEAAAKERAAERARYKELEARIAGVQVAPTAPGDSSLLASAKRALSKARAKQAAAIGAGAATLASDSYNQGRVLVEGAVENLELGLFEESRTSSAQASAAFEAAIAQIGAAPSSPSPDADSTADGARERAEDAILAASSAKAAAVAQGAEDTNPRGYTSGVSLLDSAERRFEAQDYKAAERLARDALAALRGAAGVKASPAEGLALRAIQAAEDARMDAIGRGASADSALSTADSWLDLARRASTSGDYERARAKAEQARAAYARLSAPGAAPAARAAGGDARGVAESKLVDLQFRRTEAIGAGLDASCGATFREFEALLVLAAERLDKGDPMRAYEFAILAQERLKKCSPGVAAAPAEKVDPAEKRALVAVQRARAALVRAQTEFPGEPGVIEGASLLRSAEEWQQRGAFPEAEELAKQVVATLGRVSSPKAADGTAPKADKQREAAVKALVAAQEALATASADDPKAAAVLRAEKLVAAAESWLEREDYLRAKTFADKALAELKAKKGATKQPVAVKPSAAAACATARRDLDNAKRLSRSARTTNLTGEQERQLSTGQGLVAVASARLDERECSAAAEFAREAIVNLEKLPVADPKAAKQPSAKPSAKPAAKPVTGHKPLAVGASEPWRAAYEGSRTAQQLRDQARPLVRSETQAEFAKGERALNQAKLEYARRSYDAAESSASDATAAFSKVIERAGKRPVASAPSAAAPSTAAGAAADEAAKWRPAYAKIVSALALRDRAEPLATSDDARAGLARGKEHLVRARNAWKAKQYFAAGQHADSALSEFQLLVDAEPETDTPKTPPTEGPEPLREADSAIGEAKVILDVCKREKCEERDFAEYKRGEQLVTSATQALERKDYAYAKSQAKAASKKLNAILAKPRPKAPAPKVDAKQLKQDKQDADVALREANIALKLCEAAGCEKRGLEDWLRAQALLSAARANYADQDYVEAKSQAEQAEKLMRKTLDAAPVFAMPDGISMVSLSGDQLLLSPPVMFYTGGAAISPKSLPALRELAQVLNANKDVLKSVSLVGYTDSRGNDAKNRAISATRARAVLNALAQMGVPRDLMSAAGNGADNPIADNSTPAGREANRRVEVRMELK